MNISNLMGGGTLARRRRFMTQRVERPYDAEVEYLESNRKFGYQWIQTDLFPYDGIDIYIGLMPIEYENVLSTWFVSDPVGDENGGFYRLCRGTGLDALVNYKSMNSSNIYVNNVSLGIKHELTIKHDGSIIHNGIIVNTFKYLQKAPNEPNSPFLLLGDLSLQKQTWGKLYYFKVVDNEKILIDLIPVRIADEGFMYDRVSGKLFGNVGTGKFILGPDIS